MAPTDTAPASMAPAGMAGAGMPPVGMAPVGTCVVADAERSGWVRTAPQPGLQGGWALIDGAPLGLGMLLKPT